MFVKMQTSNKFEFETPDLNNRKNVPINIGLLRKTSNYWQAAKPTKPRNGGKNTLGIAS